MRAPAHLEDPVRRDDPWRQSELWLSEHPAQADRLARADRVDALLSELQLDSTSRAAARLFLCLPAAERDGEAWRRALAPEVLHLVQALDRASQIEQLSAGQRATDGKLTANALESLRKMLLAMAEDVRVVLIKLAERVDLMRSLENAPADMQRAAAQQTMDLFAPLANRLGLSQLKWELEDHAFRLLEPEIYRRIATQLDESREERERFIALAITELHAELRKLGLQADISGRPKHLYSIYRKMSKKGVGFAQVYDVRALRVIVDSIRDCYTVLGLVHDRFRPVEGEFDDYIAHPKANNYRSLHTAVIGPEGRPLEVQIRTREMHEYNENGVAAHWRYKEGTSRSDRSFDSKIAWLRQMLDYRSDLTAAGRMDSESAKGVFDDTVYVLTPQGRVIDLPAGSTPVDFAYHVHTDLGHRCRGAKVDGHIVPLNYTLKNAQHVDIVSAKTGGPSRDWLNRELGYLHSPRALAKVRSWFRHEEHELDLATGRHTLEKELQRLGLTNEKHERIAAALGQQGVEALLIALARGEISQHQMDVALGRTVKPVEAVPFEDLPKADSGGARQGSGVLVLGVNNIATLVAKCCRPLPPDPIIGFVTRTRGVMVHRADCGNITCLAEDQRERLMPADWGKSAGALFSAEIEVVAGDRQGLLRDISEAIAREKVNVVAVNTISRGVQAFMRFTVQVTGADIIDRVRRAIGGVPDVLSVTRK
jgi:GTP pyrophosphokinase